MHGRSSWSTIASNLTFMVHFNLKTYSSIFTTDYAPFHNIGGLQPKLTKWRGKEPRIRLYLKVQCIPIPYQKEIIGVRNEGESTPVSHLWGNTALIVCMCWGGDKASSSIDLIRTCRCCCYGHHASSN